MMWWNFQNLYLDNLFNIHYDKLQKYKILTSERAEVALVIATPASSPPATMAMVLTNCSSINFALKTYTDHILY